MCRRTLNHLPKNHLSRPAISVVFQNACSNMDLLRTLLERSRDRLREKG
jgi:hypothetical protein